MIGASYQRMSCAQLERELARREAVLAAKQATIRELREVLESKRAEPSRHKGPPNVAGMKLREWMATHPNQCAEWSLERIAQEIGVTRERVRQLMPQYARVRQSTRWQTDLRKVAEFVESTPEAMLPRALGGLTVQVMAQRLGLAKSRFHSVWQALGYPKRTLLTSGETPAETSKRHYHTNPERRRKSRIATKRWQAAHPEKVKEISTRARAKYEAKWKTQVIEQRMCAECGGAYDWTAFDKKTHNRLRFCSQPCAARYNVRRVHRKAVSA